jgi:hypothetical protein
MRFFKCFPFKSRLDDSILVIFYESVHLNRNFISTLTHAATEFSSSPTLSISPNTSAQSSTSNIQGSVTISSQQIPNSAILQQQNVTLAIPTTPTSSVSPQEFDLNQNSMRLLNPLSLSIPAAHLADPSALNTATAVLIGNDLINSLSQPSNPPSNLLVIFLQSCSAILQETKIETNNIYDTIKLFMLVLVCISEDQYANSILHDSNVLYSVFLYQAVCL